MLSVNRLEAEAVLVFRFLVRGEPVRSCTIRSPVRRAVTSSADMESAPTRDRGAERDVGHTVTIADDASARNVGGNTRTQCFEGIVTSEQLDQRSGFRVTDHHRADETIAANESFLYNAPSLLDDLDDFVV